MSEVKKSKFAKLFDRYKTYDDSQGRGNVNEWGKAFQTRMGQGEARQIIRDNDPLVILGLDSMPDMATLEKVYRKLVMENHPDKGGDHLRCKEIIAAYTILKKKLGSGI